MLLYLQIKLDMYLRIQPGMDLERDILSRNSSDNGIMLLLFLKDIRKLYHAQLTWFLTLYLLLLTLGLNLQVF